MWRIPFIVLIVALTLNSVECLGQLHCGSSQRVRYWADCGLSSQGILSFRNTLVYLVTIKGATGYPSGYWTGLLNWLEHPDNRRRLFRLEAKCPALAFTLQLLYLLRRFGMHGTLAKRACRFTLALDILCSGWPVYGLMDMVVRPMNGSGQSLLSSAIKLQNEIDLLGACPAPTIAAPFLINEVSPQGLRICAHFDQSLLEDHLLTYGEWAECRNIIKLAEKLGPGCIAVDVGANIGACSFAFLAMKMDVVAFEPDRRSIVQIKASLETLRAESLPLGHLEVKQLGLWNQTQRLKFRQDLFTARSQIILAETEEELAEISVADLDSVVSNACLLKIDAEGSEFHILQGAERILQSVKAIDFEFDPAALQEKGSDPVSLLRLLDLSGFSIWKAPDKLESWRPSLNYGRICGTWQEIPADQFAKASTYQPHGFQLTALRRGSFEPCANA